MTAIGASTQIAKQQRLPPVLPILLRSVLAIGKQYHSTMQARSRSKMISAQVFSTRATIILALAWKTRTVELLTILEAFECTVRDKFDAKYGNRFVAPDNRLL